MPIGELRIAVADDEIAIGKGGWDRSRVQLHNAAAPPLTRIDAKIAPWDHFKEFPNRGGRNETFYRLIDAVGHWVRSRRH